MKIKLKQYVTKNKRKNSTKKKRSALKLYINILFNILAVAIFLSINSLEAKINVVASIPDLADMAREIGKAKVKVISLSTGREDIHAVPVRPSFIVKLSRADLLLNLGLEAEHAWLKAIAAESRNEKIMYKREGWIEVYKGLEVLEVPGRFNRAEGDQHPYGNPHFNISPRAGKIMANNIAKALIEYDPDNTEYYKKNLESYLAKIDSLISSLQEKGKALQGINIVSYHADIIYLCDFYQMKKLGTLEPKPGIQPSSRHLASLARTMKRKHAKLILYSQAQPSDLAKEMADKLNIKAIQFANAVGAKAGIRTWMDLQRYNLNALLKGLK